MSKPKSKSTKNPAAIAKTGRYGFGAGLWLTVAPTGGRSWSYRFTIAGRSRALGLGGFRRDASAGFGEHTIAAAKRQND
jgi:hypothetical protein